MLQRGGQVSLRMLPNVKQATIRPLVTQTIASGTLVYTDEYDIYARLEEWGYAHESVCHGKGEFARDDDGDGFHELHVNTIEGFWSLLRSWLRPHRGASPRRIYPCISASSSSFTTCESAVPPCLALSWECF
jgi:transposase